MSATTWMRLESTEAARATDASLTIADVIDRRLVRAVFQPVVELISGNVVAFEALSRGPANSTLERPDVMLAAAGDIGRLGELDQVCRRVAVETVIRTTPTWPAGLSLFLNSEPATLDSSSLDVLATARAHGIDVTIEFTERDVAHDVATLLRAADRVRAHGGRVALDDVGAEPASLALIPLLRPDIVKLDMALLREYSPTVTTDTANAVRAYAEESGASVVAEGIETESDVATARVLGATLGQGWLFGRPGALELGARDGQSLPAPVEPPPLRGSTPFEVISAQRNTTLGTKALLLPISRTLEQRGRSMPVRPILLATFQAGRHFTPRTVARYATLAAELPFVAALGVGMPSTPAERVRGGNLSPEDPLTGEWNVVVLGAHFAAALVARDLGDDGEERDRRFDFVVTHDRALVTAAAATLVDRVVPS